MKTRDLVKKGRTVNRAVANDDGSFRLEKPVFRAAAIARQGIDETKRRVDLSFSSEAPVERWFGREILDHSPGAVRLGRLKQGGTLLLDHDPTKPVAPIRDVEVGADRKGRAVAEFGSSPRSDEAFQEVLDEIRRTTSVGYIVHRMILEESDEEQGDTYRAVDWEPLEVSLVSIPADGSVGVGRAHGGEPSPAQTREPRKEESMPSTSEHELNIRRIADVLRKRYPHVDGIAKRCIAAGMTADQFQAEAFDAVPESAPAGTVGPVDLDLDANTQREYSLLRALRIASDLEDDGIELDVSQEIGRKLGRSTRGIFVPMQLRNLGGFNKQRIEGLLGRALDSATSTAGTETVATELGDLIEILRARMMVRKLGARVVSGLVGNVGFPRQTGTSSLSWVAENPGSDIADSDATFDQVSLAPKTAQASTAYTRQLLNQSSIDVESFVRSDLTAISARGIDLAAINGSGSSNQPRGILNTTGIGAVAGGTNGLAPTWAHILALWKEVAIDSADFGKLGFLTNAAVVAALANTEKASGTGEFVITDLPNTEGLTRIAGQRCGVSAHVPSNLTKGTSSGVCSAIIYGNFDDLMIGEWGVLELITDPYTLKKQGLIEITSFVMVDIAVRRPQSFAAMQDALTP
jgi:HK97 family phage major capsid protein